MKARWLLPGAAGLLALIVYIGTLAPTITWRHDGADSGDLAAAVAVGGVPHPPGYPTYLVLAEAFGRLPVGDVAFRLNLLSATCAALTVTLVGTVIGHTLSGSIRGPQNEGVTHPTLKPVWPCAASASLALAFSGIFWSQAVIAEVYSLNALFAALLLYGAVRLRSSNQRWLAPLLFGLLGLGLGNHATLLLCAPILLWRLDSGWRWPLAGSIFLAFCAGLSIYVVIPLRAAAWPPVNWGAARTWPNFLWLVSAEPYRRLPFALPWGSVAGRALAEVELLAKGFMGWGLPVGLLGLGRLIRRDRPLAYSTLVTFLLLSMYAIGYDTTDSYVYLLPAFLVFSVWVGWGVYDLGDALRKVAPAKMGGARLAAWGTLALLPLISLAWGLPRQNLRQDVEAFNYAQHSLHSVAPGGVIITQTDSETFALWYARYGLAMRPDVAVVNSNLLPYAWYRETLRRTHPRLRLTDQAGRPLTSLSTLIEMNVFDAPLYVGTLQPSEVEGYRLEPVGELRRVVKLEDDRSGDLEEGYASQVAP
jgi:hypothetical protein